ncbi:PadR family transcriptional regulator [Pseudolysinimonas sp.]|uniref:PadR family transcriptional regulator n=1 Tax=Pseudolysinimonas sp. TaxID=2680009 RepID=UPI003F7D0785
MKNRHFPHGFDARAHQGRGFPDREGFGPFGPGMFGPGMRNEFMRAWGGPRARKGDVRIAILALLNEAPASGYGLIKAIAEKTEHAWRPSPGSVYPTLQQLVDEGLVTQPAGPGKGDYELTDDGRAYVTEHQPEIDGVFAQQPAGFGGVDREFMHSIGRLFDAVRQFPRSATPEQRKAAAEKMDELRRELYRILAD